MPEKVYTPHSTSGYEVPSNIPHLRYYTAIHEVGHMIGTVVCGHTPKGLLIREGGGNGGHMRHDYSQTITPHDHIFLTIAGPVVSGLFLLQDTRYQDLDTYAWRRWSGDFKIIVDNFAWGKMVLDPSGMKHRHSHQSNPAMASTIKNALFRNKARQQLYKMSKDNRQTFKEYTIASVYFWSHFLKLYENDFIRTVNEILAMNLTSYRINRIKPYCDFWRGTINNSDCDWSI